MKLPPHSWYTFSLAAGSTYRLSWQVCWRCGLVLMNNEATQKRVRAGCLASAIVATAPPYAMPFIARAADTTEG